MAIFNSYVSLKDAFLLGFLMFSLMDRPLEEGGDGGAKVCFCGDLGCQGHFGLGDQIHWWIPKV